MATPDPYLPGHGDTRYRVRHYDLVLDYKVATNHLKEVATLQLEIVEATSSIELDLSGLQVARLTVDGSAARFRHRARKLLVETGPRLPGERLTLVVHVSGKPRPVPGAHGAAGWEELTDGVLVGSQPYGAPGWFPCNDDAADKASYTITITLAKGYTVVCNGSLASKTSRGATSTWRYEMAQPMSPYLATVQIGRYVIEARGGAPVPVEFARPASLAVGEGTAFEFQAEMVAHFVDLFGAYPFDEYRAVITDDPLEIPLEAQGLSSFGRNFVPPTWDNERLVAHELAHQWFGNSVTASRLADIWLHEGFACYAEWLWSDHRRGAGLPSLQQQAAHHHTQLARSPQDITVGAPGMADMFDDRVYKRGALTLHAVHCLLGTDRFVEMLRAWTSSQAGGVVDTALFARHVQRFVPDRSGAVAALLDAWLHQERLPALPVLS